MTLTATPHRRPLGLRLLPDVWHYGWWVAIAVAVVMFATVGVGYYGLAVFLRPLQEENGWSNSAVSGATGLYFSVSGLAGFLIGPLIDRRGPLRPMTIGIALVGLSAIALSLVDTLWQLYAVYVIQAVAFGMAGAVAVNSIIARWFITKRAKAMSISSTGVSMGGIVLSPLGTWMIAQGGVALAAIVMGVLVLIVGLPIVALVLVWDPAEVGLTPDAGAPDESFHNESLSAEVQQRVWTRSAAARTGAFWAILVAFVLALLAQTGFLLHQLAFLTDRFGSANRAAFALSTTALGSVIARFALGQVADRMNKRVLSAGLFVLQGAAIGGLLLFEGTAITFALVLIVGFTIGNIYMMQTLLVSETFGLVSLATVYGVIGLAAQIGSGIGPWAIGVIEDRTGSYQPAFALGAAMMVVAAVIVLAARPPRLNTEE
ncbi:MAG: MFS transporter [Actinomycetota bacterium]